MMAWSGLNSSITLLVALLRRTLLRLQLTVPALSFWCHQNRERHLDEFFIAVDSRQRAANVTGYFG